MTSVNKILRQLGRDKWYHGTTLNGWKQLCSLGVKADYNMGNELDFGYGFYLTPEQKQAEYYIMKLLEYKVEGIKGIPTKNFEEKKVPVIIEFSFCPQEWFVNNKYISKIFSSYDDEFANFVFHNRVNNVDGNNQHNYDVIFGVMSDSIPTLLIQRYKEKEITREEVIEYLKKSTSVKQISLHNQEICDKIKPSKVYYLETGRELDADDYYNR